MSETLYQPDLDPNVLPYEGEDWGNEAWRGIEDEGESETQEAEPPAARNEGPGIINAENLYSTETRDQLIREVMEKWGGIAEDWQVDIGGWDGRNEMRLSDDGMDLIDTKTGTSTLEAVAKYAAEINQPEKLAEYKQIIESYRDSRNTFIGQEKLGPKGEVAYIDFNICDFEGNVHSIRVNYIGNKEEKGASADDFETGASLETEDDADPDGFDSDRVLQEALTKIFAEPRLQAESAEVGATQSVSIAERLTRVIESRQKTESSRESQAVEVAEAAKADKLAKPAESEQLIEVVEETRVEEPAAADVQTEIVQERIAEQVADTRVVAEARDAGSAIEDAVAVEIPVVAQENDPVVQAEPIRLTIRPESSAIERTSLKGVEVGDEVRAADEVSLQTETISRAGEVVALKKGIEVQSVETRTEEVVIPVAIKNIDVSARTEVIVVNRTESPEPRTETAQAETKREESVPVTSTTRAKATERETATSRLLDRLSGGRSAGVSIDDTKSSGANDNKPRSDRVVRSSNGITMSVERVAA